MESLPLWPLAVLFGFAAAGYAFFWLYSKRLDREERRHHPAE